MNCVTVRLGDKKVLKYFIDLIPNLIALLKSTDSQEAQNYLEANTDKFPRAEKYAEEVIIRLVRENETQRIIKMDELLIKNIFTKSFFIF